QVNLIVGDYFKRNARLKSVVNQALEVVKWFNHHGRALGILKDLQQSLAGKTLCLLLPVPTRWTSYYLSVRRLLELEQFIWRAANDMRDELIATVGNERKARLKAIQIVDTISTTAFWMGLR
ncbi:hypothetical protein FA95DRAFT_1459385, partial [Auriscalpium vulgare]